MYVTSTGAGGVHSSHVNLVNSSEDMKQFKKKIEYRNDAKKLSHLQYTPLEILSAFEYGKLGVMNE